MKKLFLLLAISTLFIFTSCVGPVGPPGVPGTNILGQVFEVTTNFEYFSDSGLQESLITIPNSIEVYESDVILVYRLEKVVNGGSGGTADAWAPLPHNFFLNNGDIIQYVFNHTFFDVELLIDGNFNLQTLGSDFTDNQTFRIAIVPSEYGNSNLTMDELLYHLEMESADIEILPN